MPALKGLNSAYDWASGATIRHSLNVNMNMAMLMSKVAKTQKWGTKHDARIKAMAKMINIPSAHSSSTSALPAFEPASKIQVRM